MVNNNPLLIEPAAAGNLTVTIRGSSKIDLIAASHVPAVAHDDPAKSRDSILSNASKKLHHYYTAFLVR